jgi:hypothetical protein
MKSARTSKQVAPSEEQVNMIQAAVKTALGGLLTEILEKNAEPALRIDLFRHGVELIELEVQVGLPNTPVIDFKLKIAGPNPVPPGAAPS